MPHLRVFLADDSAMIRQRVAEMLVARGARIVGEAGTPQGSIRCILERRPDVVVLDIQLEGGTGMQVLQAVREAAPAIAFVVLSNNAAAAWRKRYLAAGAACFFDKSTEFDKLPEAVAAAAALPLTANASPAVAAQI